MQHSYFVGYLGQLIIPIWGTKLITDSTDYWTLYNLKQKGKWSELVQPVCTPARMVMVLGAMSGLTTLPQAAFKSSAMLQISAACL